MGMRMLIAGKLTRGLKAGFTLFELLIVLAIVAILAGFVIPRVGLNWEGTGVGAGVETVKTALKHARTRARLTRKEVVIRFRPESIHIDGDDESLELPAEVKFQDLVFPGDNVSSDRLCVDGRGVAPVTIVRISVNGDLYSLLVGPILGEVKYMKGTALVTDFVE